MAIVGSVIGSFDPADSSVTLERPDLFSGVTPTAAIVTVIQEMQGTASYNQDLKAIGWGVGAITSADQWACGVSLEDAASAQVSHSRQQDAVTVAIPGYNTTASSYTALMTGALVADGITLTKSGTWVSEGGSSDLLIEITFFGGDDFSAWIPSGSVVTSTTSVGGIPFRPNMGFFAGISTTSLATSVEHAKMSQGWLFDNGVDVHDECARVIGYQKTTPTGDSDVNMRSTNFYCGLTNTGSAVDRAIHTDFDTDGGNFEHNYTVGTPTDFAFLPLYMRFDNEDCSVSQLTLPSSTGTFTSTGYGHNPAVAKVLGNSVIAAYNTGYTSEASGNNFDWTIEGSGSSFTTWNHEDRATIDCYTRLDLGILSSLDMPAPSTGGYKATEVQRIADGFSMEMGQVGAVTALTFAVTLGTPAETGLNMYVGSDPISRIYLGSTEVSSAFQGADSIGGTDWANIYNDPSPAQNEGDWDAGPTATLTQDAGGILWTATGTGLLGPFLDFTTEVGRDYRLTLATGAGGIAPFLVSVTTTANVALTNTNSMSAGVDSTSFTFKAIGTTSRLTLIMLPSVSDTILIDSVLIEELR